ncbi:MAG: protein kinase [Kofleriaceae bacterium]
MSDSGADETATKREGLGSLHKDVPGLDRGSVIGRYVVLDVIGQGGMGIIYSAFDPELDRKVAIKLLQAGGPGSGSYTGGTQAWLVREAQAMARLAHPNVVAVHDVGTLDDRVFVAMELVDGETLREWLKRKHTWREVIDVMRAAGAGLVAAHAAGLVHRDFKPENVIVGADGRVRVMDFGLARAQNEPTAASRNSDLAIESRSPLTDQLTEAGTVMGTPAYMAPEIHDGLGADALSDQFAFGVTLYEALFRIRPFEKSDLVPPREDPTPKIPPDVGLPPRLQRAVMRAIEIDPKKRFPAMTELLTELAWDPAQTRRRIAVGVGFGLIAFAIAGSLVLAFRHHVGEACVGTEKALAGVWDEPVKLKIHAAFTGTKKAWAEPSFTVMSHALDGYTHDWTEAVTANCEATRIRKEQTERVFEQRQVCFDQRLEEVRSLGKLLQESPDAVVDKADKVVQELDPINGCTTDPSSFPDDPQQQKAYISLALSLASAQAQLIAGQYITGLAAAQKVIDEGPKLHADDLVATAQLMRGTVLQAAGNAKDGNEALSTAVWTAMRAHLDPIASKGALANAMVHSERADSLAAADVWLDLALSTARPNDPYMKYQTLEVRGAIQAQRGELDAATKMHTDGLEAAKQLYGADDPNVWGAENQLATTMGHAGAWVAAMPHLERALELRQKAVGPEHPERRVDLVEPRRLLRPRRSARQGAGHVQARVRDQGEDVRAEQPVDRGHAEQPRRFRSAPRSGRDRVARCHACEGDRAARARPDEPALSRDRHHVC